MTSENSGAIRRALISVSDKTGIVDFARALHQLKIEILSTGGTYKLLTSDRSEEHTSELQSRRNLVCRLLLEKKKTHTSPPNHNSPPTA